MASIFRRAVAGHSGLILALHRVLPSEEQSLCYNPHLVLSETAFASLLQLLKQDYQVVQLEDLLADPSGNGGHPKVAITFDDGWEDNYRIAFPHLIAHDMPATIFACTGLVDTLQLLPEERFARLWSNGTARTNVGDRKTVEHPRVGDINLDLDVVMAAGTDLRIVTYTAAVGTTDAEKLDALRAACAEPDRGPAHAMSGRDAPS